MTACSSCFIQIFTNDVADRAICKLLIQNHIFFCLFLINKAEVVANKFRKLLYNSSYKRVFFVEQFIIIYNYKFSK